MVAGSAAVGFFGALLVPGFAQDARADGVGKLLQASQPTFLRDDPLLQQQAAAAPTEYIISDTPLYEGQQPVLMSVPEQLPHFRDAMIFFLLPLTAVTLVVLATRSVVRHRFAER